MIINEFLFKHKSGDRTDKVALPLYLQCMSFFFFYFSNVYDLYKKKKLILSSYIDRTQVSKYINPERKKYFQEYCNKL